MASAMWMSGTCPKCGAAYSHTSVGTDYYRCGTKVFDGDVTESKQCLRSQLADRERVARYWYGRGYCRIWSTPPEMLPDWLIEPEDE